MVLDLILHHNLDPDWLISRPIDVLISLYEKHIETMGMSMPFMAGMGLTGQPVAKNDLYQSRQWKEGKILYTRTNLLEKGSTKVHEGLISSKNKR
jgi:hypothetical protein